MCRSTSRVSQHVSEKARSLTATFACVVLLLAGGCPPREVSQSVAEEVPDEGAPEASLGSHASARGGQPSTGEGQQNSTAPQADNSNPVTQEPAAADAERAGEFGPVSPPDPERFPNLQRLVPEFDVWTDPEKKRVVLRGGVCLREGPIELFACIHQWVPDEFAESGTVRRGTKEYESIVTINTTAALVHTALLAVGAEPGSPVRFTPEYEPAHGTPIDVLLYWEDAAGKSREARAQQWIRNAEAGKPTEHTWVFAGSGFRVNEETGERRYLAEEGNLICVSNFPDAVLDLPIKSSSSNEALLFEAFTEHIPPIGTHVTIVLVPRASGAEDSLE